MTCARNHSPDKYLATALRPQAVLDIRDAATTSDPSELRQDSRVADAETLPLDSAIMRPRPIR